MSIDVNFCSVCHQRRIVSFVFLSTTAVKENPTSVPEHHRPAGRKTTW